VHKQITYLCLAESDFGIRIPFQFLEDVQQRFESSLAYQEMGPIAQDLREEFRLTVQDRMLFYSDANRSKTVFRLKQEADQVVSIMQSNMAKLLVSEETDPILPKEPTDSFNEKQVRDRQRKKRFKIVGIVVAIVLICLVIAGLVASYFFNVFSKFL